MYGTTMLYQNGFVEKVIGNIYDGCIGCFSYILLLRIWPKKRPMSSDIIQVLFKQHCSLDRFIQKRSNRNYMLNNIASFPHTMYVYYETRSTRIPYCLYSIHLFTTLCLLLPPASRWISTYIALLRCYSPCTVRSTPIQYSNAKKLPRYNAIYVLIDYVVLVGTYHCSHAIPL